MTSVSTDEARRRFSELVSLAFYKGRPTSIARNKQRMAWIVGEPFMRGFREFWDMLEKEHPALADTLAILVDDDLRSQLDEGMKAYDRGEAFPLEEILDPEQV